MEVTLATKLFVGNLSFNTTAADLETLFGEVGTVASVNVITDKLSGRSRGFGFVEMAESREAQTAIERFNGAEFQGRALTVNEAKPMERRFGDKGSSSGGGRSSSGRGDKGWGRASGGRDRRW